MKRFMYRLDFKQVDGSWLRAAGKRYSNKRRAKREALRRAKVSGLEYRVSKEARNA